ncbi:hypothetical protein JL720_6478 [Aureococcus anophagefferens]|nr:hypothetical protein JL720_6478 [Aureococcus anophagefferens]
MLAAWDSMVAAVAEEEDHGRLAKPFADAGVGDGGVRVPKMQHRLTAELDGGVRGLQGRARGPRDRRFPLLRRRGGAGPGRGAWLTTLPVGCAAFTNGEFAEVAATYFGVKSPCMIPHVARRIQNTSSVVDAFGPSRPSSGLLREARVSYDREVLGVFADLVPADAATSFFEQHAGKGARDKAGIVPDFKLVPGGRAAQLADVKTIGFAKSRYGRSPARRGGTLPCDERAGIINREYRLHAEKLDKGPGRGFGSFERRLGSFGSVVGFVAGYFGELSKGAHEVLAMAAEEIAERTWVEAGATSLDHAKSIQKQRLYREWGVASVRAVARIKIEGLGLIGAPSSIPRPDYGRDAAAKRARDAAYARAARGTGGTFGVAYEQ